MGEQSTSYTKKKSSYTETEVHRRETKLKMNQLKSIGFNYFNLLLFLTSFIYLFQLTFVSDEVLPTEYVHMLKLGKTTYNLYSNSFLHFGQVNLLNIYQLHQNVTKYDLYNMQLSN